MNDQPHTYEDTDAEENMGKLISDYIAEANEDYFSEVGTIESHEWSQAAAGLIALIVLGLIVIWQVMAA